MNTPQDGILKPAVQNTTSKIARFETALMQRKIHTIDYHKHGASIHEECSRIGLEKLVSHPYLLALWARAHFAQGRYYDALNISRAVVGIVNSEEHEHLLCEEYILQARAHLALFNVSEAEAIVRHAKATCHFDSLQLFLIKLIEIRITYLKGSFLCAQNTLAKLKETTTDMTELMQVRVLQGWVELLSAGATDQLKAWVDVEVQPPRTYHANPELRRHFNSAKLLLAHHFVTKGQSLRARDMLSSTEDVTPLFRPFTAMIETEIRLLEGDFMGAYQLVKNTGEAYASGLCAQELFEYFWVRALSSLGALSAEAFCMEAQRLEDHAKKCPNPYHHHKSRLLAALGLCLTHEYQLAELRLASLSDEIVEKSGELRLLHFLCDAILAYRGESFDEFWSRFSQQDFEDLTSGNAFLLATVLLHGHPLLGEIILKSQLSGLNALKLTEKLIGGSALKRAPIGILSQGEWNKVSHTCGILIDEKAGATLQVSPFKISLLGSLSLEFQGEKTLLSSWSRSKTRELFIALALNVGSEIARDEMIERLWPGKNMKAALNSYYVAWSQMKSFLTSLDDRFKALIPVHSSGAHGYIDSSVCTVDVLEFSRTVQQARMLIVHNQPQEALEAYEKASQLYTGDLLPGDTHLEWLDQPREHYHALYIEAMITAAETALALSDTQRAIFFINDALQRDHNREKLFELAMRAYAQASRREDAIKAYLDCKRYLQEELGLDPSKEITDLYLEIIKE